MSRDGSITFGWADGEYKFRLAIGELRELQEKCDHGPEQIYIRLDTGRWRVDEILEPIRLGLIGGGMEPNKARVLVQRYVSPGNIMRNIIPAQKILAASLVGTRDESAKKVEEGANAPTTLSQTENGASPSSTEMVQ